MNTKGLLESLEHWNDNVKSFPSGGDKYARQQWFGANCNGYKCPCCQIRVVCKTCPLDAPGIGCCNGKWEDAKNASTLKSIIAVRDYIKSICKKHNLI